jgi:hypothetical protein
MILFPDISESDQQASSDEDDSLNEMQVLSEVNLEHLKADNKHTRNTKKIGYTKIGEQAIEPVREGFKTDQELWKTRTQEYNYSEAVTSKMLPLIPDDPNLFSYITFNYSNSHKIDDFQVAAVEKKYKAGAVLDLMSKYPLRDVVIFTNRARLRFADLNKSFHELIDEGKIDDTWSNVSIIKKTWFDCLLFYNDFPPVK